MPLEMVEHDLVPLLLAQLAHHATETVKWCEERYADWKEMSKL